MAAAKDNRAIPERLPARTAEAVTRMDDLMARTVVENLSLGIDPLTGNVLGDGDCCANEMVQEALRIVLEHCSLESYRTILHKRVQRAARKKKRYVVAKPRNVPPKTRNDADDKRLIQMCQENKSVLEMAREMKCSVDEICERLKHLQ